MYVSAVQGSPRVIELVRILQREIGRPPLVGVDQIDFDLSDIFAFVHYLRNFAGCHFFLLRKSGFQMSGSGLYAVTRTAGA
jgi:hypothetical protein